MLLKSFEHLRAAAGAAPTRRAAVVCPHDPETVAALVSAAQAGLILPVLVGDPALIQDAFEKAGAAPGQLEEYESVTAGDEEEAAAVAVALVRQGGAQLLMKGLLDTKLILQAVLRTEGGLRTGRVLSHVAAFSLERYDGLLLLSDAAITIAPTLDQKREILLNAVEVAQAVGAVTPQVAMVCAKEKVDSKMPATQDAESLRCEAEAGQLGSCLVSGPLALDNAVSLEAAQQKGIRDPVAGRAEILLMPNIEAANALYKALVFLAGAENAGIVVGAGAPIVLTSRADSHQSKLNSIALAALHAGHCMP